MAPPDTPNLDPSARPGLTLRWLLTALALGCLCGLVLDRCFFSHWASLGAAAVTGLIGMINSVVVWGGSLLGFRLLAALQLRGSPPWIAARLSLGWLAISSLSVLLAALIVRILLGVHYLHYSYLPLLLLISLAIGGCIMGYTLMKGQVLLSRELGLAQGRAQAMALQAQLSPHTLFNSLNTIAALIPESPELAEQAVRRLSRLLRRILQALDREQWTLAEEFDLIRDWLELEHSRFGERLRFQLELPEPERCRQVPPLILLPLVENCLKHGFRPKVGSCLLRVEVGDGRVLVSDDGVGRNPEAPDGVGLRTVRQRVQALGGSLRWLEVPVGATLEVQLWS